MNNRCSQYKNFLGPPLITLYAVLWSIWKVRNDLVFKNIILDVDEVTDLIKFRVAFWVKGRCNLLLPIQLKTSRAIWMALEDIKFD